GFRNGKGNAYETELRDRTHGRIYRVVYAKAKDEKPFSLKDATPDQLIAALKHPNMTWRLHAQRLLTASASADTVGALLKALEDKSVDETGNNPGVVHALHALATLGALDGKNQAAAKAAVAAAAHPSAAVRVAALAVVPRQAEWFAQLPAAVFADASPKVQLAGLLALAELPASAAGGGRLTTALAALTDPDAPTRAAVLAAASAHDAFFLADMKGLPDRAAVLDAVEAAARSFAGRDDQTALTGLLAAVSQSRPAVAERFVAGLAAGWPAGKKPKLAAGEEAAIAQALAGLPAASRGKLLKLAAGWGVQGIEAQLAKLTDAAFATLADTRAKDADRVAAAQQIVEFRTEDEAAASKLLAAVAPDASPALAAGIFEALAQSRAKGVSAAVVAKLRDLPPAVRPVALQLVLARPDSTKAFLDAVEAGTLRFDMLALDQRQALASHPDRALSDRAKRILALGGGLPSPDRQEVIEELRDALSKKGSVDNGKKMFVAHCAKCHKHGSEGTAIGPDLTGFGVHPKEELAIAILDPSRSVEGNFKLYRAVTADDRTILGILGAQTGTTTEIIDAEAKRHQLAKADIVSIRETDKSLMPEGFEKVMKPEELTDLLEFLSQKGKFVPLDLGRVATVVSTKDMFFDAGGTAERLIFPDWKPKVFDGIPFTLVDPQKDTVKNVVMLNGPQGNVPPKMPKSVSIPFSGRAKAVHMLSGVGGWSAVQPAPNGTVSMVVRLTYEDGKTEDHELKNGVHFADYIRRVDVPGSKFAFALRSQQVRYLSVSPKRPDATLKTIELVKGPDRTAPIVMAITVESP
ncbi:MAG: c-type cytochrome, partial [Gemmata sp.]